jgi:hypothetical protein
MSLTIGHSTNVVVKNWSVLQPAFWATLIWDSRNVLFKDVYVNATREDDANYTPTPLGWVQNTDGSNTYLSHNVTYGQSFMNHLSENQLTKLLSTTPQKTLSTKVEMIVLPSKPTVPLSPHETSLVTVEPVLPLDQSVNMKVSLTFWKTYTSRTSNFILQGKCLSNKGSISSRG